MLLTDVFKSVHSGPRELECTHSTNPATRHSGPQTQVCDAFEVPVLRLQAIANDLTQTELTELDHLLLFKSHGKQQKRK